MNTHKFSKEDKELQLIWFTAKAVKENRVRTGVARQLSETLRHRQQVVELINDITHTLKSYNKWSSGYDLVPHLLATRHRLECYNDRIYRNIRTQPALTLQQFNDNIEIFQNIINEFQELYERQ